MGIGNRCAVEWLLLLLLLFAAAAVVAWLMADNAGAAPMPMFIPVPIPTPKPMPISSAHSELYEGTRPCSGFMCPELPASGLKGTGGGMPIGVAVGACGCCCCSCCKIWCCCWIDS